MIELFAFIARSVFYDFLLLSFAYFVSYTFKKQYFSAHIWTKIGVVFILGIVNKNVSRRTYRLFYCYLNVSLQRFIMQQKILYQLSEMFIVVYFICSVFNRQWNGFLKKKMDVWSSWIEILNLSLMSKRNWVIKSFMNAFREQNFCLMFTAISGLLCFVRIF